MKSTNLVNILHVVYFRLSAILSPPLVENEMDMPYVLCSLKFYVLARLSVLEKSFEIFCKNFLLNNFE